MPSRTKTRKCRKCGKRKTFPKGFAIGNNSRRCKKCINEYASEYAARNIEHLRPMKNADATRYRERHRQEINTRVSARRRELYRTSPDYVASTKAWKANRDARKRGLLSFEITGPFILSVMDAQHFICASPVCRRSIRSKYHVDHVMPLALGGQHDPKNIQILCPPCNVRKQARHPAEWLRSLGVEPSPEMLTGPVTERRPRKMREFSKAFLSAEAARKQADGEPGIRKCNQCRKPKHYPEEFCAGNNHRVCLKCKREYNRKYAQGHIRKDRRKPGERPEKPTGKHQARPDTWKKG